MSAVRNPLDVIGLVASSDKDTAKRMLKDVLMFDSQGSHASMPLALIRTDGGTQPRAEVDPFAVDEYADSMRSGVQFPSVTVFYDGEDYWLADGFHRVNAARKVGLTTITADVRQGTRRDAVLYSVGANATHGLRRTNADKRRAVEVLLRDTEWVNWSDREIARKCGVGNRFVGDVRRGLTVSRTQLTSRTYKSKHGTTAKMKTRSSSPKTYVYERAPEPIKKQVANGEMTPAQGEDLTRALEAAAPAVAAAAIEHGVQDPQLVELLDEKRDTQTVKDFLASGVLQPGEEADVIPASVATALDLAKVMRKSEQEHKRTAYDLKLQAQFDKIRTAPPGVFSVVYADPSWRYDNAGLGGSAENHYPTMPTEDICRVPRTINLETAPNAVLFLWATNPFLQDALAVCDAWGFEYKTNFVWVKDSSTYGKLGFYAEGQHELLLIATRGSFLPNFKPKSVIEVGKGRHSEKPRNVYTMIETMYPEQRYIELFARKIEKKDERTSWAYWGLEAEPAHASA